jgi:hypothetical protein
MGSVAKNGGTKKPGPDFSLGGNLEEALHKSHLPLNVTFAYLSFTKTSSAFSFNNLGKPDITC